MSTEDFVACNVELVKKGLPLLHGEEIDTTTLLVKGPLMDEVYQIATRSYEAKVIESKKDSD